MSRWKVNLPISVKIVFAWFFVVLGFWMVSVLWEQIIGISAQKDIPLIFYGGIIGVGLTLTLHILKGRKSPPSSSQSQKD